MLAVFVDIMAVQSNVVVSYLQTPYNAPVAEVSIPAAVTVVGLWLPNNVVLVGYHVLVVVCAAGTAAVPTAVLPVKATAAVSTYVGAT